MCEIPQLSYPHVNLIKLSFSSSWTAAKHLICSISFYSFKCILLPSGIIKTNSSRSYCVKKGQWNNGISSSNPPLLTLAVWYPFQNSCCHFLIPQRQPVRGLSGQMLEPSHNWAHAVLAMFSVSKPNYCN